MDTVYTVAVEAKYETSLAIKSIELSALKLNCAIIGSQRYHSISFRS